MAQLLPSSPSTPQLIPRSCRVPPTQAWVDRSPAEHSAPRQISPHFPRTVAHRTPLKSSPCSLRSACYWNSAVPGSQHASL